MFRLNGKIVKDGKIIASCVSRQEAHFDLPVPIWLPARIKEFQTRSKTSFLADSFLEEIPFDALEIQVIEE